MDKPKNVQIPYETFISLLDTLEYLDMSNYSEDFKMQLADALEVLRDKKRRLELRDTYTAYKTAHGHQRDDLRIEYMQQRKKTH